jgi:hypothetical protein
VSIRRALIWFDLAGNVPSGATITDATLTMNMSMTRTGSGPVGLHLASQDWGEGDSNAAGEEGTGVRAADGDATWLHTFSPADTWTTPGGDFADVATDSISVGGNGKYTWGAGGSLISDVQNWLDDPTSNFGWMVVGDESSPRTAKRFDSTQNPVAGNRPTLTITFDGGLVGDCNGDGLVDAADLACVTTIDERDVVLAAIPTLAGDLNGDGQVEFSDFLKLSANFGQSIMDYTQGDVDLDGSVEFPDFLTLANNFGRTPAAAAAAVVPEPGAGLTISVCVGFALTVARRRRRSQIA